MPAILSASVFYYDSLVYLCGIFHITEKHLTTQIIIADNHFDSDYSSSKEYLLVTKNLTTAGKLLEIPVMNHIIIGYGDLPE